MPSLGILLAVVLASAQTTGQGPRSQVEDLGRRSLAYLYASMQSADPEVRAAAAASWGEIGKTAAVTLLLKALKDASLAVRIEAATSLHKLGDGRGQPVLEEIIRRDVPASGSLSPAEEMRLLARNKSRILAIERLAEMGGEKAVALFEKTLRDPSGAVRDATAVALARMGLDEFQGQFVDALRDADEGVRQEAVRALGGIGQPGALGALQGAASDSSVAVRGEAMKALGRFSDAASLRALTKGVKDEDARVRAKALASLAGLRDPGTTDLLKEVLRESAAPEIGLRASAGLALRGEAADLSLAAAALGQKDADLKALALELLRRVETPQSDELLGRVLDTEPDARLRVAAAALLVKRLGAGGRRP